MSKDLTPGYSQASGKGQFLVYETEDGQVKIDVRLEDETVWLTHQLMVELFQSSQQNISREEMRNLVLRRRPLPPLRNDPLPARENAPKRRYHFFRKMLSIAGPRERRFRSEKRRRDC